MSEKIKSISAVHTPTPFIVVRSLIISVSLFTGRVAKSITPLTAESAIFLM
jgi:hypothetical protein